MEIEFIRHIIEKRRDVIVGFEGYKFTHKLIASHCFQYEKNPSSVHAHTFEITLYIALSRKSFTKFQDMEEIIPDIMGGL